MSGKTKPIIVKEEANGCWICISHKSKHGNGEKYQYSVIRRDKEQLQMTKYFYEFYKKPLAEGQLIMHSCDNPPCVNPEHLIAGTQKQNIEDAMKKNRITPTRHRKLKPEQVLEIFNDRKGTCDELAAKYNTNRANISEIRRGNTWGWLTLGKPLRKGGRKKKNRRGESR